MLNNKERRNMKKEKLVCTYCQSDKIEYVPTPFQGQESWFDVRYEQQKNGKFKAVIKGDTPEKENADVTSIDTRTMSYNDSRPWMHCLDCSAEVDVFIERDYEAVCS